MEQVFASRRPPRTVPRLAKRKPFCPPSSRLLLVVLAGYTHRALGYAHHANPLPPQQQPVVAEEEDLPDEYVAFRVAGGVAEEQGRHAESSCPLGGDSARTLDPPADDRGSVLVSSRGVFMDAAMSYAARMLQLGAVERIFSISYHPQ